VNAVERDDGLMPTDETLTALARDRGLTLTPERLHAARDFHAMFRDELDRLRAVELDFLPPYIEPQTAVRWIENGGRSASAS
jgi:hypothetical protein